MSIDKMEPAKCPGCGKWHWITKGATEKRCWECMK